MRVEWNVREVVLSVIQSRQKFGDDGRMEIYRSSAGTFQHCFPWLQAEQQPKDTSKYT